MLQTPVIIIIYKRPNHLRQVLASIAQAKPAKMLVIGDGPHPNHPEDLQKIRETRALFENLSWDCNIITNYSPINLGLRKRVSSGLSWAFNQVESGIILEDDCVPDPSFFNYSQQLLERYESDNRIMTIAGNNFQKKRQRGNHNYYYSRYSHCWGWATWKRSWDYYDDQMEIWPEIRDGNWLYDILDNNKPAVNYWKKIFQNVYENKIESWAYRWTFSCWVQGGLTILPKINLVKNIGYGEDSTHTSSKKQTKNLSTNQVSFPLKHPPFVIRDTKADTFTQDYHFGSKLSKRAKRKLAKILIHLGLYHP